VAPVTIGEGAYVATGTTVTADVPPGALAIGPCSSAKQAWLRRQAENEICQSQPKNQVTRLRVIF